MNVRGLGLGREHGRSDGLEILEEPMHVALDRAGASPGLVVTVHLIVVQDTMDMLVGLSEDRDGIAAESPAVFDQRSSSLLLADLRSTRLSFLRRLTQRCAPWLNRLSIRAKRYPTAIT